MQSGDGKLQFRLKSMLLIVAAIAIVFGLRNLLGSVAISNSAAFSIEEGMTQEELLSIAGRPHTVGWDGTWYYCYWEGLLPSGGMGVEFDDDGVVDGYYY